MKPDTHVLIVDDDEHFREVFINQIFLFEGFELTEAANGVEALKKIETATFDLIFLDVKLPDIDGREVCRQMRARGIQAPIIMLTGASTDDDAISGLDAGANDYITKPFSTEVLFARIRAHIRYSIPPEPPKRYLRR